MATFIFPGLRVFPVRLQSLKRSLDEREGDEDEGVEPLGKWKASRSLNSVRAIAKPGIALLEDLVAQASEEEEVAEEEEDEEEEDEEEEDEEEDDVETERADQLQLSQPCQCPSQAGADSPS